MGILVVEDNMLLSLVYENYIQKLGYTTIETCEDGETAVKVAKDSNPDLILMDIFLNGEMDGIEAMKHIREFSDVPVIYITGNSDQKHAERAAETNYIDYLIKPITLDDLKNSIDKVINGA